MLGSTTFGPLKASNLANARLNPGALGDTHSRGGQACIIPEAAPVTIPLSPITGDDILLPADREDDSRFPGDVEESLSPLLMQTGTPLDGKDGEHGRRFRRTSWVSRAGLLKTLDEVGIFQRIRIHPC